jgi:cadmium resistance protein CadD (predicted permease)
VGPIDASIPGILDIGGHLVQAKTLADLLGDVPIAAGNQNEEEKTASTQAGEETGQAQLRGSDGLKSVCAEKVAIFTIASKASIFSKKPI